MTVQKSLPWVELLANQSLELLSLRDEVTGHVAEQQRLLAEANRLELAAIELRNKASEELGKGYHKSLKVESLAKDSNGIAAVEHVKRLIEINN
jgi:hypothetical protein